MLQRSLGVKDKAFTATLEEPASSKRFKPVIEVSLLGSEPPLPGTTSAVNRGLASTMTNGDHQDVLSLNRTSMPPMVYSVPAPYSLQLFLGGYNPYGIQHALPHQPSLMPLMAAMRDPNSLTGAATGVMRHPFWSPQQHYQQPQPQLQQHWRAQQQQQWPEQQQQQVSAMLPSSFCHGLLFDAIVAANRLPLHQETPPPVTFTSSVSSTTALPSMISSVRPLPFCLSVPTDDETLSHFQVVLRQHVQAFAATSDDVAAKTRGRNKKIHLNQVGLRCRHCAHVSAARRGKGSVYFPASILGFYQAAQNISAMHLQCGLCPEMPDSTKTMFAQLLATKTAASSSTGGRTYWGHSAQKLGDLVDTDQGVFARSSVPDGVRLLADDEQTYYQTKRER